MNKRISIGIPLTLALLFVACDLNGTTAGPTDDPANPIGDFAPLAVGNHWEYGFTAFRFSEITTAAERREQDTGDFSIDVRSAIADWVELEVSENAVITVNVFGKDTIRLDTVLQLANSIDSINAAMKRLGRLITGPIFDPVQNRADPNTDYAFGAADWQSTSHTHPQKALTKDSSGYVFSETAGDAMQRRYAQSVGLTDYSLDRSSSAVPASASVSLIRENITLKRFTKGSADSNATGLDGKVGPFYDQDPTH